jgi:sugar lactone lactonase YvrE
MSGPNLSPYGAPGQPFNEIVVDAAGRAWVDMPGSMPWEEPKPGTVTVVLPDGSCHQVADDLWYPNGMVILGEDTLVVGGEVLDAIPADRGCFACMLGGGDGSMLYIVANRFTGGRASGGVVLKHAVAVPHAGRP